MREGFEGFGLLGFWGEWIRREKKRQGIHERVVLQRHTHNLT